MKYFYPLLLISALFVACSDHLSVDDGTKPGFSEQNVREGMVRIRLKPQAARSVNLCSDGSSISTGIERLDAIARKIGATRIERSFAESGENEWKAVEAGLDLWYDLYFDDSVPVSRAYTDLAELNEIDVVEPDYPIEIVGNVSFIPYDERAYEATAAVSGRAQFPSNDPLLKYQWGYNNDGSIPGSIAGADINLFRAWEVTAGSPNVTVAVVDGGIAYDHDDLKANMWQNDRGEYGWNFVDNTATIVPHDHGSHVAGTIGAVNNNGIGVAGIAGGTGRGDGVKLMSCQIFKTDPSNSAKDIFASNIHEAIRYGADNGAVISQNSWGYAWLDKSQKPPTLLQIHQAAIDYFIRYAGTDSRGFQREDSPMKGGIVIFAAGNDNTGYETYPAAYDKVISVGGIASDFQKGSYSNYGEWVLLSAPGGDYEKAGGDPDLQAKHMILSTMADNEYGWSEGTSMACPHVSGIAALVLSYAGGQGFTPEDLKSILLGSCNDLDRYQDAPYKGKLGVGYIDAALALRIDNGIAPEPVTDLRASWLSNSVGLTWTVTADDDNVKAYRYDIFLSKEALDEDADLEGLDPDQSIYVGTKSVGEGMETLFDYLLPQTDYYVAIRGVDLFGNISQASFIKGNTLVNNPPVFVQQPQVEMKVMGYKTEKYGFSVTEPDGHPWSVSATGYSGTTPLPSQAVYAQKESGDHSRFYLVIDGPQLSAGNYTVVVRVEDKYGESSDGRFDFSVLANNPPQLLNPMADLYFNSHGSTQNVALGDYFRDADGEKLTYAITSTKEGVADVTVDEDGIARFTAAKSGKAVITVTATDFMGAKATGNFTLYSRDGSQPVEIYPNPVVDNLNFRVGPGDDQTLRVVIRSATGRVVVDREVDVVAYEASQLDLSGLSPGRYTMTVTMGDKEVERDIVKL